MLPQTRAVQGEASDLFLFSPTQRNCGVYGGICGLSLPQEPHFRARHEPPPEGLKGTGLPRMQIVGLEHS